MDVNVTGIVGSSRAESTAAVTAASPEAMIDVEAAIGRCSIAVVQQQLLGCLN